MYGLRHTVAVILRELGYDEGTIADALGHKTIEMARRYAEGADLKPKMRGVVASFDAELGGSGGRIRTADTRIIIPLWAFENIRDLAATLHRRCVR